MRAIVRWGRETVRTQAVCTGTLCSLKGPSRAVRIVTRDFTALDAVYYRIVDANCQQH
jgi:hypothetical protein